eukprot:m.162837 g.162837  ORF g.162837 m.162837 type:complete len:1244 (-) comp16542_c0_seq1:139-3870(-)
MAAAQGLELPPPAENGIETQRVIFFNDGEHNKERSKTVFAAKDNRISTSKYTLLTFLPINLLEQFMRAANLYFLVLLILQLIPAISSLSPITTAFPLVFVLGVTAVKDGNDDYKRHASDSFINGRTTCVLRDGKWTTIKWRHVVTGDIIRLKANDFVPCDMLVLSTSEEDHDCYIETADLDGETNLKKRYAPAETRFANDEASLGTINGQVRCDAPNNKLEKFDGTLFLDETATLNSEHIILRGCRLRNTVHVHGLAVYVGRDTKLMRNSGRARFKRTHIDLQLNGLVLQIFLVLFIMCMVLAIGSAAFERTQGDEFSMYLNRQSDDATEIGTLQFFSYLIVLSNLVPISLYVSVELIRVGQSLLIGWDREMYYKANDTPAVARTTTLNEELGQIDYVFSDKTGTLTQNVMRFIQCSINGTILGRPAAMSKPTPTEADDDLASLLDGPPDEEEGFVDETLQAKLDERDPKTEAFFRLLAICHTVRVEVVDGVPEYQAQSPDEKALVEGARDTGFEFTSRTSEKIHITARGEPEEYTMLNIIQFNSTRKRMTVVLQNPDGSVTAYSKGADNVMEELLSEESRQRDWASCEEDLHEFAKDGLRTLVLCQRELEPAWFQGWAQRFEAAETALEERDEKIAEVAKELECEFTLVGATAIEDRLQDEVPQTIANIMRAKIKLWVLTGDKQETAINIGFSCRLLNSEMEPLLIVNGKTEAEVKQQLQHALDETAKKNRPNSIVITGAALTFPLPPTKKERDTTYLLDESGRSRLKWTKERLEQQKEIQDMFVEATSHCHSVLCCRVSPLQKAQVVTLIKEERDAITLAIGDGANDVSMIKAAHIGVGISGLEGRQAVMASDFSIAQFKFLQRLLLVHGRWSYLRMTTFLNYFFYKNFAYAYVHFFFGFYCGYSGLTVYDAVFISTFNVIYSSLPILVVGILEQDVNDRESLANPFLYEAGPRNILFDRRSFYWSLLRGAIHGCIIFFMLAAAVMGGGQVDSDGIEGGDYFSLSAAAALTLTWVVNFQLAIQTRHWTWLNWVTILVGPLSWFFFFGIQYNWDDQIVWFQSPYFGAFDHMLGSNLFWGVFFLTVMFCMVASYLEAFTKSWFMQTPIDIVREQSKAKQLKDTQPEVYPEIQRSETRPLHSAFDFAQEDDVGRHLFPNFKKVLAVLRLKPKSTPSAVTPTPRLDIVNADASLPASGNASIAETPMPTDIDNLSPPQADTPGGSLASASPSTATQVSRVSIDYI